MVNEIFEMIQEAAATTKRGEKEAIVEKMVDADDRCLVIFDLALNPYLRFGVKANWFCHTATSESMTDDEFFDLLVEIRAILAAKQVHYSKAAGDLISHHIDNMSVAQWEILQRCIDKDLNCGIGVATVNKLIGKKQGTKIPDFKVAKASEAKELEKLQHPAYGNIKYDGARCWLVYDVDTGEVDALTSSGRQIQQMDAIKDSIKKAVAFLNENSGSFKKFTSTTSTVIFDGELLMVDTLGNFIKRQVSNGVVNKMTNGNASTEEVAQMRFFVFDVVDGDSVMAFGEDREALHNRFVDRILPLRWCHAETSATAFSVVEYETLANEKDSLAYGKMLIADGHEGAIIKDPFAPYELKRMKSWVKIKAVYDVDLVVTGVTPHKKDPTQVGAIEVETSCGTIKGHVGTGHWLTIEKRREIKSRVDNGDFIGAILWCRVMEVTKNKDGEYSFYIPRIEEERFDKVEADDFDKVMAMFPAS